MPSTESTNSSDDMLDLNLPVFSVPQVEHWPLNIPWLEAVRHFDSIRPPELAPSQGGEARLCDKNRQRFVA